MIIRPFRSSDKDRILEFKRKSVEISFPTCEITTDYFERDLLKAEEGSVLVAEDNSDVIGYIFLKTKRTTTGSYGVIQHLFVHPDHRGKGIASQLMEAGEGFVRSKNLSRIRSTVTLTNEPSLRMVRKLGYNEKRMIFEKKLD